VPTPTPASAATFAIVIPLISPLHFRWKRFHRGIPVKAAVRILARHG
jgi:hypothetical protein